MKKALLFGFLSLLVWSHAQAQDTFSIVALDSVTGEVGSAGASCVNLFAFPGFSDDFLGVLFPGLGAINTQAFYLAANQNNATARMQLGETPAQIIKWLVDNDATGQPELRQYGVTALVGGSPQSAAHTGTSTDDYKGQRVGPNYAIQGNILLGPEILDSMEARFLNTDGDLACKLMAAMQGANVVGADTRCAPFGTSSLFAFLKVAQPNDSFGDPSFLISVRTNGSGGLEPIDSLQSLFDLNYLPRGIDSVAACDSFTWLDGITYTQSISGPIYRLLGAAASGCDSLVSLSLSLTDSIDVSTTLDSLTIQANAPDASYQWLLCGDTLSPIEGANNQAFTATEDGAYAVEVTVNGCTDTSDCVSITTVGLETFSATFSLQVYPNPTDGSLTLQVAPMQPEVQLTLRDVQGRTVQVWQAEQVDTVRLFLEQPAGVYSLEVLTPDGRQTVSVVKQ